MSWAWLKRPVTIQLRGYQSITDRFHMLTHLLIHRCLPKGVYRQYQGIQLNIQVSLWFSFMLLYFRFLFWQWLPTRVSQPPLPDHVCLSLCHFRVRLPSFPCVCLERCCLFCCCCELCLILFGYPCRVWIDCPCNDCCPDYVIRTCVWVCSPVLDSHAAYFQGFKWSGVFPWQLS